jgi:hypothetical protein
MQLFFYPFFWKFSSELNWSHISKPLILTIMISEHMLFEFFLSFILIFMHNHMDFKGIYRKEIVVFLYDIKNLVFFEMWQEIHYKLFIVLQNNYSELLEHMS